LAPREAGGRLVEHHQLRVAGACHSDLELPLLPVRERADELACLRAERDARRELAGPPAQPAVDPRPVDGSKMAAVHAERGEVEVVLDREAEEEPRRLVGAGDAEPRAASRREMRDVLAEGLD